MRNTQFIENELLSREAFKRLVFLRSKGVCVFCGKPAADAHHVLERKLFPETQGYFLGNGAAVCDEHHWACETTKLTVEEVRAAAGIVMAVLPPRLSATAVYDKWGNVVWPSGLRTWGPLFEDVGARRALAMGGVLGRLLPPPYTE